MVPRILVARGSARTVIYAAIVGNMLVAMTKLAAALWTGSSVMLSEAVHSIVDTGNELLLLYGLRRAAVPPDHEHPLGHGREIYFWSFVVALLVFALGRSLRARRRASSRHRDRAQPAKDARIAVTPLHWRRHSVLV